MTNMKNIPTARQTVWSPKCWPIGARAWRWTRQLWVLSKRTPGPNRSIALGDALDASDVIQRILRWFAANGTQIWPDGPCAPEPARDRPTCSNQSCRRPWPQDLEGALAATASISGAEAERSYNCIEHRSEVRHG